MYFIPPYLRIAFSPRKAVPHAPNTQSLLNGFRNPSRLGAVLLSSIALSLRTEQSRQRGVHIHVQAHSPDLIRKRCGLLQFRLRF